MGKFLGTALGLKPGTMSLRTELVAGTATPTTLVFHGCREIWRRGNFIDLYPTGRQLAIYADIPYNVPRTTVER